MIRLVLGIVPIACEELFKQIEAKKDNGFEYQVTVSMLEIYCEKVRDLLDSKGSPKGGLKVREHPKKGFYGMKEKIQIKRASQDPYTKVVFS